MSFNITDTTTKEDIKNYLANNKFNENIIQFLLEKGTKDDLDTIKDIDGYNSLLFASTYSNTDSTENTVKMLIDAGVNLNIQTNSGSTALMLASTYSNTDSTENTVKMLIDAGADLNIQNKLGNTALMGASAFSNTNSTENTVKMLIDAGADLNIQSKVHDTALILASMFSIRNSTDNTVKMLIDAGADLNIQNNDGNTAYDYLKKNNPTSQLLPLLDPNKEQNILLNQRIRVNITKTVSFEDPIMLTEEEINIGEYIEEDKDNIVFVYNKNMYFFTTRDTIMRQKDDATIFPCKVADTMRPENIISDKPLYDLKKIGFLSGYPCVMEKFLKNIDCQLFALINTDESYPSFVSDNVLNRHGSYVSGLHCQAGQESKISYMVVAVPSIKDNADTIQMGGVRTLKDIKKFEKKMRYIKTKKRKTRKAKKIKSTKRSKGRKTKRTKKSNYKKKSRK